MLAKNLFLLLRLSLGRIKAGLYMASMRLSELRVWKFGYFRFLIKKICIKLNKENGKVFLR